MFSPRFGFVLPCNVMKRPIHVCTVNNKDYSYRQGKMMAKLMVGSLRKKKNWYNEREPRDNIFPSKSFGPNVQGLKRVDVLNKLLMRSITDLLSTGEVTDDILGQGISISRVSVTQDFSVVNVYWSGKGKSPNDDLEELLKRTASKLRHELCQLHLMSNVPRIEFVADKKHILMDEVERRLAKVNLDLERRMGDVSEQQSELQIQEETPLPPMTHDVLGLDHAKIMRKLEARVRKSKALHRHNLELNADSSARESNADSVTSTEREITPADFANFIKRQKIAKKKQMKQWDQIALETELLEADSKVTEEYVDMDKGDFMDEFEENFRDESEYR